MKYLATICVVALVLGTLHFAAEVEARGNSLKSVAANQASCVQAYSAQPWTTGAPVITLSKLLQCLKSVAMNVNTAQDLANASKVAFDIYSFRESTTASGTAISNLMTGITTSSGAFSRFVSELEFVHRATSAFNIAKDLHFGFVPPVIYSNTFTVRPYVLASRYNSTSRKQELYIDGWTRIWEQIKTLVAADPTRVGIPASLSPSWIDVYDRAIENAIASGVTITSINGLDPITEWIPSIQGTYGYNDTGANVNAMLRRNFMWPLNRAPAELMGFTHQGETYCHSFATKCDRDAEFELLQFSDGTEARGVKLVSVATGFYEKDQCQWIRRVNGTTSHAGHPSNANSKQVKLNTADPFMVAKAQSTTDNVPLKREPEENAVQSRRRLAPADTTAQLASEVANLLDGTIRLYQATSGNLAIIEVNSFSPDAEFLDDGNLTALINAIDYLKANSTAKGNNRLLIDVSGNGGGFVALMDILLQFLFPSQFEIRAYATGNVTTKYGVTVEQTNFPSLSHTQAPFFSTKVNPKLLSNNGSLGGDAFYFDNLTPVYYGGGIFNNTHNTDGNLNEVYRADVKAGTGPTPWYLSNRKNTNFLSPYYAFPVQLYTLARNVTDIESAAENPFTDVTLLTDGTCGSACSMFESRIRRFGPSRVRTITYGGWKNDQATTTMQTSQFCGGTVIRMTCISGSAEIPYDFIGDFGHLSKSATPTAAEIAAFYPADVTTNVRAFYTDSRIPTESNTPRQLENSVGDTHWWIWEPTFDEKINRAYSDVTISGSGAATMSWIASVLVVGIVVLAS